MLEKEYLDTLCSTGDGAFIVDANRHIIRWNKAAEAILKYSEDEVLNRSCFQVISGKTSPDRAFCSQHCKIHNAALKGVPQKNFDLLAQTGDGKALWLNVTTVSSLYTMKPLIVHIVRDVTREKNERLALDRFLTDLESTIQRSKEVSEGDSRWKFPPAGRLARQNKSPVALSDREIEVLTLLAEGLTTKNLALKLNISHFTARNHIQNILAKLDLHSKAQVVSYAFRQGIL
jgi:PAS domain S-box-containing protein